MKDRRQRSTQKGESHNIYFGSPPDQPPFSLTTTLPHSLHAHPAGFAWPTFV